MWNYVDVEGWSACHRAGAYGRGEDIRNLDCKGGNMNSYTTNQLWGPMTCSVWHSNESTFDAFMDLLPVPEILSIRDSRCWTLLHMAARNGCRHILRRLLEIGADTEALTVGTEYWVTSNLAKKNLTAETIAQEYGHGELWNSVLEEAMGGQVRS